MLVPQDVLSERTPYRLQRPHGYEIFYRSYNLNVDVFVYFYQKIYTSESCLKLKSKLLFPGSL